MILPLKALKRILRTFFHTLLHKHEPLFFFKAYFVIFEINLRESSRIFKIFSDLAAKTSDSRRFANYCRARYVNVRTFTELIRISCST